MQKLSARINCAAYGPNYMRHAGTVNKQAHFLFLTSIRFKMTATVAMLVVKASEEKCLNLYNLDLNGPRQYKEIGPYRRMLNRT